MHFCILGGGVGVKGVWRAKGGVDRLVVVVFGSGGIRDVALITGTEFCIVGYTKRGSAGCPPAYGLASLPWADQGFRNRGSTK
jgi:hypothetical protein